MSRPYLGREEIDAIIDVVKSGWITTGPKCAELEENFARYTGALQALTLSSGTAGMHLVLKALGIGNNDEVITPSITFASTVNQIVLAGAKPVFADVDYDTLLVRPEEIEKRITKHTKAIIPVHFAGAPADMDAIESIARDIPVIEDAAHAVGTFYKGRHIGWKNLAVYSFHPIKNITTAEGGMITGSDKDFMARVKLMRFHGIERDAWKRYGRASDPSYDITEPGHKYNMTDIQAALGTVQLRKIDQINEIRSNIANRYLNELASIDGLDLPGRPQYDHVHSWHLFVVKILSMDRPAFMEALARDNIGYGLHFPACHRLSYVRRLFGDIDLPETEAASQKILSLPLYPGMSDENITRVIETIKGILA
ncbi:MAG: aminotransferase class I/II-fold pyridoxal phosphate-dependent enzyme [Deltaproteobacteria bacterium]|nr:aminotransferase class I/II-fold pyridoxal phosphate-dependent enzyme [Deltaproteobacteria bacterium]